MADPQRFTLQPCPWCKSAATLAQDCDGSWSVSCSQPRCPVLPISAGYRFAHMATMAWNCCGSPTPLPELMPPATSGVTVTT